MGSGSSVPLPGAPLPGTPPAEVNVDEALVAALLADQHPDLAGLPLREAESGWDNAMFRLGDELAVRLPRRALAAQLIVHEQAWLPVLAGRLPLPIPAPIRAGAPGRGYPWRWSVVPWLPGAAADLHPPDPDQAPVLGAFLRALHGPAPADAPTNPYRGGPLSDRGPFTEQRLERLAGATDLITPQLRRLWQEALEAPIDSPRTWLHGDLHPRNILADRGALSAVIDWGDVAAGDGATDLAAVWMLFDDQEARRAAFAAYGPPSAATLLRARGWAIFFGAVLLDTGMRDNPRFAAIGERTLRSVVEPLDPGA
jgi:aminoglycoside phosphotransferase (APT) family kinase protein